MKTFEEKTSKEKLLYAITEHMTENQCAYLYKVVATFSFGFWSKSDLVQLTDLGSNLDTSLPQTLCDKMRELNPNFQTWANVYDYNSKSFGELKNVCEEFVIKLNKVLYEDDK